MSKTEILEELPKLAKTERQEIRLRWAELDSDDSLDDEELLTVHERALLDTRLAAYAKNPDAGSTWEEIEAESKPALVASRMAEPVLSSDEKLSRAMSLTK